MERKSPLSFSKIANTILASVSGGSNPNLDNLHGKLDLSLWRNIGDGDDEDDEEEELLLEESGQKDLDRGATPPQAPSPILAPLLAVKKSSTFDHKNEFNECNDSTEEGKDRLSPLSVSSHLLSGKYGKERSNLETHLQALSPKLSSSKVGVALGSGWTAVDEEEHEEEKPQESGRYARLPPILQRLPSSSSTTLQHLSRLIASYQLSNAQFPSGSERERSVEAGAVKRVEFKMGAEQVAGGGQNDKQKRNGSGKDEAVTRSRSGSAVRRPLSRTQTKDILQEIRKMSLASQDALEEKKKAAATAQEAPVSGRKYGKRAKQKRRKPEEIFTDKDRAAAVTLGSKDIKQSLKAKKKRDRKMRLSISFMSGEDYVISALLGEANYQMRVKKQPEAALQTLNKALEIQPTHKGALVSRSQCYLKLGDAESALQDAKKAYDPNNPNENYTQGLYQYAEALYQLGEFENALIAFHRGHRSRKDMDGFRIGIQKCQEAIKRAIGDKTATSIPNLDKVLPLIQELEDTKARMLPEERKQVELDPDDSLLKNIARYKLGENIQLSSLAETKIKSKLITRELMGQLYLDKAYLKKFINRPEVINQQGLAKGLRDEACEALKYLEGRERFWRQQNPLYARKNFSTVLKAHAHDVAFREMPVSEDPSVAKYLQRRRSSAYLNEGTPPPATQLQMRRRSSEPQLDKVALAKSQDSSGRSRSLRKTPSTESSKGNKYNQKVQ